MVKTKTSSFGASARLSHDSSDFYNSKLYKEQNDKIKKRVYIENKINPSIINKIHLKSSENMEELRNESIHLMVTSPPYNVGKEYDEDLSLEEYRLLLKNVFTEVYRVLVHGGRACINIANVGRKPYIPLHAYIIEDMQKIGFLMRGEIIWDKSSSAGTSTAWGSWQSATNPTLRDTHEYILVFSKENFNRHPNGRKSTIDKEEFLEYTKSVWRFPAESAKRVGHPAPFSLELPSRLIKLYTLEGDVILDPFIGSGTTAIAAKHLNRNFVGYEINKEYKNLADKRLLNEFSQQKLLH
ncbi:site-specific DNA-methyltransferase [Candidatus Woesearchaeota archaeon]|nr:site-specific DNA-methyltransferase [Candidatus Woesearchaeota archaeon]